MRCEEICTQKEHQPVQSLMYDISKDKIPPTEHKPDPQDKAHDRPPDGGELRVGQTELHLNGHQFGLSHEFSPIVFHRSDYQGLMEYHFLKPVFIWTPSRDIKAFSSVRPSETWAGLRGPQSEEQRPCGTTKEPEARGAAAGHSGTSPTGGRDALNKTILLIKMLKDSQ